MHFQAKFSFFIFTQTIHLLTISIHRLTEFTFTLFDVIISCMFHQLCYFLLTYISLFCQRTLITIHHTAYYVCLCFFIGPLCINKTVCKFIYTQIFRSRCYYSHLFLSLSNLNIRLYLVIRSPLRGPPIFTKSESMATARSHINVSSVSTDL